MRGSREWWALTLLGDIEVGVLWLVEVASGDAGDVVTLLVLAASTDGHEGHARNRFVIIRTLVVVVIVAFIIIVVAAAFDEVVVTIEDVLREALSRLAVLSWLHVGRHTARWFNQGLVGFIVSALHLECVGGVGGGGGDWLRFRLKGAVGGGNRTTKPCVG